MRENKTLKVALVLLIAVVLTTCTISGTFAKYVSGSTGSDTARVAKWDIKLNGEAWSDTVEFDLFTYTDTNVTTTGANDEKIIAPGTEGTFEFSVKNDSEVAAKYSIELDVTNNNNIPVEFKVGEGAWAAPTAGKVTLKDDTTLAIGSAADTVTVYWRWAFTGSESTSYTGTQTDATDTALGEAGTATITVNATINAEQVD